MLKNRVINSSAAIFATIAMGANAAMPSFAEGKTYAGQTGGASVVLEKYLIMDQEANVPNVSFAYSIAPGAAQDASAGNSKVFAGNDASAVTGAPTIAGVTFAVGDTTYTSVQDLPASVNTQNKTDGSTLNKDALTLAAGKKYARKDIVVNFSAVTFKEPGVYRYIITETASDTSLGITDDADATRVMDVYVVHDAATNECVIQGYVLHNNANDAQVPVNYTEAKPDGKAAGFVNDYETENLTLAKTVTGVQGSRDEYFKFTLEITGGIAGTKYDVILDNADATTKTNGINTEHHTNPAVITLGADGSATAEFWLQHGQSIVVQGIAKNTAYSVKEDKATLDKEGYGASAALVGDTVKGANAITMSASDTKVDDDHITADTTVTYTNNKDGVIPTGIMMSVAPYGVVVLVGVAGRTAIVMNKRKKEEE